MAQIRVGTGRRKRPSTKGAYILRVTGGRVYAQAWPRKRGPSKVPYVRAQQQRMKVMAQAVKRWPSDEQSVMREGLDEFLAENRGVRGTAAIRLRDWLTSILTGRAWSVDLPDGRRMWSVAVVRDCSDFLDLIEPRIGSMFVRTGDTWLPTVNCGPGYLLTCLTDRPVSGCCPTASMAPKDEAMGGYG